MNNSTLQAEIHGLQEQLIQIRKKGGRDRPDDPGANSRVVESEILSKLGVAYYQAEQWQDAREILIESLNLARDLGQQWHEAVAQYYLGFTQQVLGEQLSAVKAFFEAYFLFRSCKNNEFAAQMWQQINQVNERYLNENNLEKVEEISDLQLRVAEAWRDGGLKANVLIKIGQTKYNQKLYQEAISYQVQVLEIGETLNDDSLKSLALAWLGCSYRELEQFEKALEYFERRLTLVQELGDRPAQKETLGWVIHSCQRLESREKTLHYYQIQLQLAQEVQDAIYEYNCFYDLSKLQFNYQQYQEALSGFETALQIAESLDEESGKAYKIANSQFMLGQCYRNLGQQQEAVSWYEQAVDLYRKLNVTEWSLSGLEYLVNLYRNLKQDEQVIASYQRRLEILRELGDRTAEQSCLYKLANFQFNCQQYQEALSGFETALQIAESLGEESGKAYKIANSRYMLGRCHENLKQPQTASYWYEQAVEFFKKALILAGDLDRKQDKANAYYMLGLCFKKLENFEESQKHFKNALTFYKKTDNSKWIKKCKDILYEIKRNLIRIADSCIQEGISFTKAKKFDRAIRKFEKALKIYQELNCASSQATALANLGSVYRECKDFDKSVNALRQAIVIEQNAKNHIMETFYLNMISLTYQESSDFYQTIGCLKKSLEIQTEKDDLFGKMRSLKRLGDVYKNNKKNSDSIEYYTKAFECVSFYSEDTIGFQLEILQELGYFLFLGENGKLILSLERCLKVAEKNVNEAEKEEKFFGTLSSKNNQNLNKYFVDKTVVMICLSYLGMAYSGGMNYDFALQCHEKYLALLDTIKDKSHYLQNKGSALNNLAGVLRQLGRYQESLQCLNQCIEIKQTIQDKLGEDKAWARMGDLYRSLGQPYQAITAYERALEISNEINDSSRKRSNLISLGRSYLSLRQPDKAIDFFELSGSNKYEDHEHSANHVYDNTYCDLAQAYVLKRDYQKALEFTDLAVSIAKQKSNQESLANCYSILGQINLIQKDYKQAKKFLYQSLIYDQKAGLKTGKCDSLIKLAFASFRDNDIHNAKKLLFQSIDLLETFRLDLDDKHKIALYDDQNQAYKLLQQVLICQNKCNQALEISERGKARAFVELLNKRLFNNIESSSIKPPSFEEIQQIAINNKTTLVEYSIIDDGNLLLIWLIKPTGELSFQQVNLEKHNVSLLVLKSRQNLGIDDEIQKEDRDIIDGFTSSQGTHSLKILYEILIKPIENDLPKDPEIPVIVIPEDALFFLPFACLECDNGKYLSEHHTITVLPSIQSFDFTQQYKNNLNNIFPKSNSPTQSDLVIVGNPLMPENPQSVPPTRLRSLPGTEIEAEAISKIFNANPLIGQAATKTKITQKMPRARLIHFATHGLLHDIQQVGIPGAVALAPGENDNGFLTSGEIYNMKLQAQLVVLSACNTGQGKLTSDGVIGLSRCLLAAGAFNVIVSLWEVNDLSTAVFMIQFYQTLQQQPDLSVVLALRQTQTWLRSATVQDLLDWVDSCAVISPERRKQMKRGLAFGRKKKLDAKRFESPYYWAAFCAIGA